MAWLAPTGAMRCKHWNKLCRLILTTTLAHFGIGMHLADSVKVDQEIHRRFYVRSSWCFFNSVNVMWHTSQHSPATSLPMFSWTSLYPSTLTKFILVLARKLLSQQRPSTPSCPCRRFLQNLLCSWLLSQRRWSLHGCETLSSCLWDQGAEGIKYT